MKLKLSLTFSAYPGGGTLAVMATFFAHYEVAVIFITNIHAIILIKKMKKILLSSFSLRRYAVTRYAVTRFTNNHVINMS